MNRRRFVEAVGAGGMAAVAGCGGGDGDEGGTTTATTATTTTTTTAEGDDSGDGDDGGDEGGGGEETTAEEGITHYDNELPVTINRPPPAPPDAQYQQYAGNRPNFSDAMDFVLVASSYGDGEFHGEIAREWNYRPGLIEIEMHDDWYYWDGSNIDADDFLLHWRLQDFVWGGEELNAHENTIRAEKTGDYAIRLALADTWREDFAITQTINANKVFQGSPEYYRPWLQRFQDAANQEAIQDLRTELDGTSEKDPTLFYHNPYKITGAQEDRWELTLRTEENNVLDEGVPHLVDELNYLNVEITTFSEEQRVKQLFLDGTRPYGSAGDFNPDDLDFETTTAEFARPSDQWSFLFNCSQPPTDDVHFRKAMAYMTNREQYMRPSGVVPNERVTGYMIGEREERFISADVLDSLTDYGWNEVREEEATAQMQEGGFERNGNGMWTYREGDRAGEPMEFTIGRYRWQDHVGNQGTNFQQYMADWGIDVTFQASESHWGDIGDGTYEWAASYWGGGFPAQTMATNFGEVSAFGAGNPQLPATVEAPPVGEPDGSLETYETSTMAARLAVTQDDTQYQNLVDRLAWVYNQLVPRFGIEGAVQRDLINSTRFDVLLPEEAPERWLFVPYARIWNSGILSYVPEGER